MSQREGFGDVELMLMEYLADVGYCVTTTPSDLLTRLADGYVLRIARTGGGDVKAADHPRVSVQVFALGDYQHPRAAYQGAEQVRALLLNLPAVTTAGRLDSAETEAGPTTFPWPDPQVTVVQCVYRLATRR